MQKPWFKIDEIRNLISLSFYNILRLYDYLGIDRNPNIAHRIKLGETDSN